MAPAPPRLLACLLVAQIPLCSLAGLRGEYGFLSSFDGSTVEEVQRRVRFMQARFGIMEFEFFHAFEGFSHPPQLHKESWTCAYFEHEVRLDVLRAAVQQAWELGARSWLRIDPAATDPGDQSLQEGFIKVRTLQSKGKALKDMMAPDAAWAHRVVPQWAEFAAALGFSGLLWATDVAQTDLNKQALAGVPGFLRAARPLLEKHGLEQAWIFRGRSEWDASVREEVAFPYFSIWSVKDSDWSLISKDAPSGSVFAIFPGQLASHEGESWNADATGVPPFTLAISRWRQLRCRGSAYLLIGDGAKYAQTDFYPTAKIMNKREVQDLVRRVFDDPSCPSVAGVQPSWWRLSFQPSGGVLVWLLGGAVLLAPALLMALACAPGRSRRPTSRPSEPLSDGVVF